MADLPLSSHSAHPALRTHLAGVRCLPRSPSAACGYSAHLHLIIAQASNFLLQITQQTSTLSGVNIQNPDIHSLALLGPHPSYGPNSIPRASKVHKTRHHLELGRQAWHGAAAPCKLEVCDSLWIPWALQVMLTPVFLNPENL